MTASEWIAATRDVILGSGEVIEHLDINRTDPSDPMLIYRLANICRRSGRGDLWRAAIDIAGSLQHVTYEQLYHRATARLMLNDWSGWADYEVRIYHPRWARINYMNSREMLWTCRRWDGIDDLRNKTLLVLREGGFGDLIQMLRFIPEIARRARRVIIAVQPEMVTLVRHNYGHLVGVTLPEFCGDCRFDYYTWSTSLPAHLGGLPPFASIEAPGVTQRASHTEIAQIGVCWGGGPNNSSQRDISLSALEPLLNRSDVQWHSLQVGFHAREAEAYGQVIKPRIPLSTFAQTATLMSGLDAIVTTDTSVAHLAGSLGLPTFLLLRYAHCWRWALADTTAWYPTMQLIRQSKPGEWSSVVERLRQAVDDFLQRTAVVREAKSRPSRHSVS